MDGLLDGLEERERHRSELDAEAEADARAGRGRVDPQPDRGQERVRRLGDVLDGLTRAGRPLDADDGRGAEVHVEPELLGERRADDLFLDLAVQGERELRASLVVAQADERVGLGELGERQMQGALVAGAGGDDDGLQRGRREVLGPGRRLEADRVADPRVQAPQLRDPARLDRRPAAVGALVEDADGGRLALLAVAEGQAVADADGAGEQAGVGDLLPRRAAFDLEDGARDRAVRVGRRGREQVADAFGEALDALAGDGRAEVDGEDARPAGLGGQGPAESLGRGRALVADVVGEEGVVMLGEQVGQLGPEHLVGAGQRAGPGAEAGDPHHGVHRDRRGVELLGDLAQQAAVPGALAVDLVDEQERRDAQAPQRPHQDAGLGLHALDGRDHQDRAVEHAEGPFDLGDEVGVAGRVDEVDGGLAEREGDHGGLDGDAAAAFERERVGQRAAVVDAADLVGDAGLVEQPLGQAGLTGVDMGQDAEVECAHVRSCPPF